MSKNNWSPSNLARKEQLRQGIQIKQGRIKGSLKPKVQSPEEIHQKRLEKALEVLINKRSITGENPHIREDISIFLQEFSRGRDLERVIIETLVQANRILRGYEQSRNGSGAASIVLSTDRIAHRVLADSSKRKMNLEEEILTQCQSARVHIQNILKNSFLGYQDERKNEQDSY